MPGLNEVETLDVTDTLEVTHVTGDEREAAVRQDTATSPVRKSRRDHSSVRFEGADICSANRHAAPGIDYTKQELLNHHGVKVCQRRNPA